MQTIDPSSGGARREGSDVAGSAFGMAARSAGEAEVEGEVSEFIPARMLNEFVYWPRLFYLEWVDDRWADNADTEVGRFTHRAVEGRDGALPDPEFAALRLQYSVFLCDLSELELAQWRQKVHSLIDLTADSVIHIDLGRNDVAADIVAVGVPRVVPPTGPIVL
jgi:hypothetical protein